MFAAPGIWITMLCPEATEAHTRSSADTSVMRRGLSLGYRELEQDTLLRDQGTVFLWRHRQRDGVLRGPFGCRVVHRIAARRGDLPRQDPTRLGVHLDAHATLEIRAALGEGTEVLHQHALHFALPLC